MAGFEAGIGRRLYAPVLTLAFASVELALDRKALEVDSGRMEVEGDSTLGQTWEAVSGQRALAAVESVQVEIE
jgi:hypothetical protein